MGRRSSLTAFTTSRIVARQVVNVVLVQLTDFGCYIRQALIHFRPDTADFLPAFSDLLIHFHKSFVYPFFKPFDGMKEGLTLLFECQAKIFALFIQFLVVLLGAAEIHSDLTDKHRDCEKNQYRAAWRPC